MSSPHADPGLSEDSESHRPSSVRFLGGNPGDGVGVPLSVLLPSGDNRSPDGSRREDHARRHSTGSTYSPSDITDSYFVDVPVNDPPQAERAQISDASLNEPSSGNEKRISDSTIAESFSTAETRASRTYGAPPSLRRSASHDSYTRGPMGRGYSGLNPHPARTQSRDVESGQRKQHGGILGHLQNSITRFTQDQQIPSAPNSRQPSRNLSRRNSWASGYEAAITQQGRDLDNFERSQVINADTDDTYLIDENEGLRHRRRTNANSQQKEDRPKAHWHEYDDHGRRKTYNERRKKSKHVIRYNVESTENYQKFILLFAKALLTFGSPSHRIEAQLNSLARVFEIEAQFQHTPGVLQVSFGNPETKSSETCLIKSSVGLALGRVNACHNIYRAVLHDDMSASEGTYILRKLLHAPPRYGPRLRYFLSFMICFLICGIAFGGSLNDMWVAGVMGLITRIMLNIASKSDLSASGSEVFTAAIVAFAARGFSSYSTQIWCFTAISSASVISLLPGHLILSGSLDIAGKNQALGAPKIVSGIMTSLYLGFGLTLGSDVFLLIDKPAMRALHHVAANTASDVTIQGFFQSHNSTSSNDSFSGTFTFLNSTTATSPNIVDNCFRDPNWDWYLKPLPYWTLFLLVPLFAFCASMNNQQHWWSRQMVVMVVIACISFWITRLCNLKFGLHDHPDYVSLIGSWLVGILGNGYSRRFGGTAFTAMLTGILLLVPDGLSAAGGLSSNYNNAGQDEYTQSLTLARKMISVIIGILAGVYSSAAIIYLFGKKKNAALVTF